MFVFFSTSPKTSKTMALSNQTTILPSLPMLYTTTIAWTNCTNAAVTNETFSNDTYYINQMGTNKTEPAKKSSARHAIYVYPGPVICVFGMVCNILNFCVLSQPELKDSPYTFLTALAVADFGMLTISFCHLVSYTLTPSYVKSIYDVYIFFALGNICYNCSVWFIVVMTIERMLFVTRPLQMRSSVKRARITIVVVVICCCLLNVPRLLCYQVKEYKNTGIYYTYGTEFRKSRTFHKTSWFHAVMINFIPIIILAVANFILILTVHRARKHREEFQMNSNQEQTWRKDEARLTKTLISVVILFIVCTFPSAFVEDPIAYALFGGDKTWDEYLKSPANKTFIYVSNLLLFLNSALNFVLYCAFNDKFRKAMMRFFGKLRSKRFSGGSLIGSQSRSSDSTKSNKTLATHV